MRDIRIESAGNVYYFRTMVVPKLEWSFYRADCGDGVLGTSSKTVRDYRRFLQSSSSNYSSVERCIFQIRDKTGWRATALLAINDLLLNDDKKK